MIQNQFPGYCREDVGCNYKLITEAEKVLLSGGLVSCPRLRVSHSFIGTVTHKRKANHRVTNGHCALRTVKSIQKVDYYRRDTIWNGGAKYV